MLNPGFYCALGTPLDQNGRLLPHSYARQIEQQIANGVSGLLSMGTMGIQGCVRSDQFRAVAATAVEAAVGRVPVMVGAFDNSIARVNERISQLKGLDVAIVLTAPYYFELSRPSVMKYFRSAAESWGGDVYIYDHPFTARYKCNYPDMLELMKIPNVKGIKTGDLVLLKALMDTKGLRDDFTPIFSNSDLFVVGRTYGVKHYLDGIFACFPKTAGKAERAYAAGDFALGKELIDSIMHARDEMFVLGIWPAFTAAMNLLGCEGTFGPDYDTDFDDDRREKVRKILVNTGEL